MFNSLSHLFLHNRYRRKSDRYILREILICNAVFILVNACVVWFLLNNAGATNALWFSASVWQWVGLGVLGILWMGFVHSMYAIRLRHLLSDIQNLIRLKEEAVEAQSRRLRLEALGAITAGISHEINGALQSVLGSCEQAKHLLRWPEKAIIPLEKAISNSLHTRKIVNNLLMFSKDGKHGDLKPCDVRGIVEEAAVHASAFLPPSIRVRVEADAGELVALVDRIALIQVISNLVNNAAHAMDYDGDIRVMVREEAERAGEGGTAVRIEVEDRGVGIPSEDMGRIFTPFFTTKKVGEGTGLGLSIVYGVVQAMKGTIDVESHVGKGSVFKILIPQVKDAGR